jgi:hypothetical protein
MPEKQHANNDSMKCHCPNLKADYQSPSDFTTWTPYSAGHIGMSPAKKLIYTLSCFRKLSDMPVNDSMVKVLGKHALDFVKMDNCTRTSRGEKNE